MSSKISGICHICGKETELTFEHLPPRKANNNNRAKAIVGDELTKYIAGNDRPWDFSSCKYKDLQKGMGLYSLCQECNNNTGTNYADEYIKFANTIGYAINKEKIDESAEGFTIYLKDFYVLRITKQIYAMFASTLPDLYISNRPQLQRFILDKNYNDVDWSKFRLSVYAMKEGINGWTGIMSFAMQEKDKIEVRCIAELVLYPLCFVLEFDPIGECENTDITYIADGLKYDTKCNINLPLYYRSKNSFYPFDYRTKDKIEEDMVKNKKKTIEHYIKLLKEKNIDSKEAEDYFKKYINNEIILGELSNKIYEIIDKSKICE